MTGQNSRTHGQKTMLPHNSHICLCTCTKFATCLLHYIISDFWNFCLSMLIRSCPIDRTKFEIPRPRSVGFPRRGPLVFLFDWNRIKFSDMQPISPFVGQQMYYFRKQYYGRSYLAKWNMYLSIFWKIIKYWIYAT